MFEGKHVSLNLLITTIYSSLDTIAKLDKDTKVGQHIQLYNTSDEVQVNGGSIWNFGGAKRKFKGAENVEVDLSFWSIFDPIDSHSVMHSNVDVWEKYIEPILK